MQWLLYLIRDLEVQCTKAPVLYCDNQSAIYIGANPVFHERTKRLEIDCHIVRENYKLGYSSYYLVASFFGDQCYLISFWLTIYFMPFI